LIRFSSESRFKRSSWTWTVRSARPTANRKAPLLDTASPCVTRSADVYRRIGFELFEDILAQKVVYAEMTIASHRVPIGEIAQAIYEAYREAVPSGELEFGILVGLFRRDLPEVARSFVRQAIDARMYGVVGLDLLAHETGSSAATFANAFGTAREAGLGLRAHAGEGAGPQSVWDVIRCLGVSRIAHGTKAAEDPELVSYLAANGITVDMCPTSNYRLRVVNEIHDHPVRRFFEAGVKITVSSDDPLFFNSNLTGELEMLQRVFGFTAEEMLELAGNGIDGAFLPQEKKSRLHRLLTQKHREALRAMPENASD
jgi:adenosine deaminase